jgi:carbon-monoxide dehydrogenase medium subunit
MQFHSPRTENEALHTLAELGNSAMMMAGGTDVMVQYQRGEIHPESLVHIGLIERLDEIAQNGTVRIGTLVCHRRLATDSLICARFPSLAEAASTVGGWQTQEAGTIGGNLCNASPAADTAPPLLVADAAVHLAHAGGGRTLPLSEFLLDRRLTARRPDELLTVVELPDPADFSGETYLKVGPRSGMEVALVGLAVRLTFTDDGATVADARIAACSVGPRPFRATVAEAVLVGSRLEQEAVAEAGQLLAESARPIDDARGLADYRRRVLAPLLGRAVDICRRRALGG